MLLWEVLLWAAHPKLRWTTQPPQLQVLTPVPLRLP
jgi:hypothetical protein